MVDKPIFTQKFTAEFNTSQDTLRQLASMEWNIDELFRVVYSAGIDATDITNIKTLYHYVLYVYADRIWAMSWTVLQDEAAIKEKALEAMYEDWIRKNPNKAPIGLLRKLREYKRWLYEVKQKRIKLGVPTRTETTAAERMDKAAGV
jgi:hypothetical protein